MTTREQVDTINAFDDGKGMERRLKVGEFWYPVQDRDHLFDFNNYDYRLKPEPPSEEVAKQRAWINSGVAICGTSFSAGWEAAKEHFTKP